MSVVLVVPRPKAPMQREKIGVSHKREAAMQAALVGVPVSHETVTRKHFADEDVPNATLRFLSGWHEVHEGQIKPGAKLIIDYDPSRLTTCRLRWREAQVWHIDVNV